MFQDNASNIPTALRRAAAPGRFGIGAPNAIGRSQPRSVYESAIQRSCRRLYTAGKGPQNAAVASRGGLGAYLLCFARSGKGNPQRHVGAERAGPHIFRRECSGGPRKIVSLERRGSSHTSDGSIVTLLFTVIYEKPEMVHGLH